MAKKGGKKPQKSGKTDKGKSPKAQAKNKKPAPKKKAAPEEAPAPKMAGIQCQFCGKAVKDERTKKVHERSCKAKPPKSGSKRYDFESELLKMKDRFEDERQSMEKVFQEREDHLQRELEEVKTVLRLEIDRHRKELERISKVEREVAEAHERESPPVEEEQGVSPAAPESHPPPEPQPARPHSPQPRAIDLIPLRLPALPKRKLPPLDDESPIPDLDEPELPKPPKPHSIGKEEVAEMVREVIKEAMPAAVAPTDEGLTAKVSLINGRLDAMDSKTERGLSDLKRQLERIGKEAELKKVEKELEKISERVLDIMEDSGYGESLSVAKIPPTILEIVYQAILDDVHIEIIRTKGAQDAEKIARSALEEVRLKTSGSELFKFDGRKIVTDNLAKSIEMNLISAKQIQTTYDVLMDRLLETVPHHKAKNFKGMIKVKSQEFAVDRATKLTKEFARIEKTLETTTQMVAAMSANFNARNLEFHDMLTQIREGTMASKADRGEMDALKTKMEESNDRCMGLSDDLALLRAELEMKSSIKEKEASEDSSDVFLAPGEEPFMSSPDIPEGGVFTPKQPGEDSADVEPPGPDEKPEGGDAVPTESILGAVSNGADSKAAIMRKTSLAGQAVAAGLAQLVEAKKIIEKRSGKRVRYTTLELELGKLKEEDKPPKGKKPGKRKAQPKSAEPEAPEAEAPATEELQQSSPGIVVLGDSEPEAKPEDEKMGEAEPAAEDVEPAPEPEESVEPAEPKPPKKGKARSKKKAKKAKEEAGAESPELVTPVEAPEPETPEAAAEEIGTEPSEPGKSEATVEASEPPEPEPEGPAKAAKRPRPRQPRKKPEAPPEEAEEAPTIGQDIPPIIKTLEELSEEEASVLGVIPEDGLTLSGIQSKVGKHMKRATLLRALRILIDSGHVGIIAKGRMELYQRINVTKMDKPDNEKNKKEVK